MDLLKLRCANSVGEFLLMDFCIYQDKDRYLTGLVLVYKKESPGPCSDSTKGISVI